jgi:hypothetical protein
MKVGNDEFCIKCMDWLEYDDEGRCKKCRTIIHKLQIKDKKDEYSGYNSDLKSIDSEENDNDI